MGMVFCRGCGKEIHDSAPVCPHCGAVQTAPSIATDALLDSTPWMAIASMVLGVICFLALIGDDSGWDASETSGLGLFSVIGLALGIISLNATKAGKKMAITGIVLACIAGLAAFGLSIQ
jgi:hypothetical protein